MGFYWGTSVDPRKGVKNWFDSDRSIDTTALQWLAIARRDDGGMDLVPVPMAPGCEPLSVDKLPE